MAEKILLSDKNINIVNSGILKVLSVKYNINNIESNKTYNITKTFINKIYNLNKNKEKNIEPTKFIKLINETSVNKIVENIINKLDQKKNINKQNVTRQNINSNSMSQSDKINRINSERNQLMGGEPNLVPMNFDNGKADFELKCNHNSKVKMQQ